MKNITIQKLLGIFVFLFLSSFIASCARQVVVPTATPFPENTQTPTTPPTATEPPTQAVILSPDPTISELATFTPTLSIDAVNDATPEQIAEQLLIQWLEHFKSPDAGSKVQLDDYKIQEVRVPPEWQYLVADEPGTFIVEMIYSVRPVHWPSPDWVAGNGNIGEDNWITDSTYFVRVIKNEDTYTWDPIGTSP